VRIGIFSDSWVPNLNGVVISIINEVQSLRDKHEFVIFVPKLKQALPFEISGIPIIEVRSFPFPAYPGYNIAVPTLYLSKCLRKERLDFIHCHSPFSLGFAAVLNARVFHDLPFLNTYHTDLVQYSGHVIGGFQAKKFSEAGLVQHFTWSYIRWFYKYSDVVVTPSKTLQQQLKSHGVNPPVYSLPNMISSVFFKNNKPTKKDEKFQKEIREKYNIKNKQRIILYCGRVSYEKKLEVLLNAFKTIEKQHPDAFLLIVGDGPHLKMYKKQASQLNLKNCAFTGFISHTQLPFVYRMGDFMVTPSDTETQGLTVIEAMSQGIPVIGPAGGGVLDYIQNGINGLLFSPGDHHSLIQAINKLIDDNGTLNDYGNSAFKTAQKFSAKGFITLLEKAFKITMNLHESR